MKQWFYNTKFFKICKAVLVFLMGSALLFAPACFAEEEDPTPEPTDYSMTWVPYDDQTDFKTEILYAPNLSTTPVWTDFANLGGSVTYNPLVSSTRYIYGFTDYRTNYIYGFRIYGTLKGWNPFGYCMWSFTGLRYDEIGWPLSEAFLSYGYLLYTSWQTDSTATCGASAFNEVYNTYTASISTANYSNMQDYDINVQDYTYNSYIFPNDI